MADIRFLKLVPTVAGLSAMAFCMFVFIWWWFPRAYARGQALQRAEWDEQRIRRQLAEQRALEEEHSSTELADEVRPKTAEASKTQMPPPAYVPPVTPY